jgi:hypothetical protein
MFHGEEEIKRSLICARCNLKYVDPRIIIPCFETLCINCIEDLTENKSQFNCHFCRLKHAIPVSGFPANKTVAKLLTLKASDV